MNYAIILAAGKGSRFGESKQLKLFRGKPLFFYSLEVFLQTGFFHRILVVYPSEAKEWFSNVLEKYPNIVDLVAGGKERSDSVKNALFFLSQKYPVCPEDQILIHDSARPMVQKKQIEAVLNSLQQYPAVSLGYRITDALKKTDDNNFIINDIDRKNIWALTTPQGFRRSILEELINKDFQGLSYDETSLFLSSGLKVYVVEDSRYHIKITYPEDWEILEKIFPE